MQPVVLIASEELPLELFATHSPYKSMRLSPDGKHIAFTYEIKNNEVRLAIITSDMKKITASFGFGANNHIIRPFWANNNRIVMTVVNSVGSFDRLPYSLYAIAANIDGSNRKRLSNNKGGWLLISDYLREESDYIIVEKYIGSTWSLQKLNVNNGRLKSYVKTPQLFKQGKRIGMALDLDTKLRFVFERRPGKDNSNHKVSKLIAHFKTAAQWKEISLPSQRINPSFEPAGFNSANDKFYFISNMDIKKGDTKGVFSINLKTEKIKLEFRHQDVDVKGIIKGPRGEILGITIYPGYPSNYYFDENDEEVVLLKSLSKSFPSQVVTITNYSSDGAQAIVRVASDKNPGEFFHYNRKTSELRFLASTSPEIDSKKMSPMEAFNLQARDGVKLYGYLTLPANTAAKNLPLIVIPHKSSFRISDFWGYSKIAQLFASRGYAVIQVSVRGSNGFGEDFKNSGYNQWGRKIQDDITDATLWALKEGIADKNKICLYGESYGGYAAIQGLVREPDLYKCGVGVAGFYSIPMILKGANTASRSITKYNVNRWLNNYLGKNPELFKQYSPAYNVDKIKAAILIIHGTNDVLIPIQQAEFLKSRLVEIGKPYEWLVREEGHGFSQTKNRVEQYKQVLAFFKKHIGK